MIYWQEACEKGECRVIVLPLSSQGAERSVPPLIEVNKSLIERGWLGKLYWLFYSVFSPILWSELVYLLRNSRADLATALRCLATTARFHSARYKLGNFLKTSGVNRNSAIYCYWNEYGAYAAASLKKAGIIRGKILTRCHGYDLYEFRRVGGHMPLKRQFLEIFDRVFPVSKSGLEYFSANYGYPLDRLEVGRLGVGTEYGLAPLPRSNVISLLTIGSIIEVKRLDRIIDVVAGLAENCTAMAVRWVHIGSGDLERVIKEYAAMKLDGHNNVCYEFLGHLQRKEVMSLLSSNEWDVCLNMSDSEGVPVSLMEAMSVGIPVVAPEIGGVPELLADGVGTLLSDDEECVRQAISVISSNKEKHRDMEFRMASRNRIVESYDAAVNYRAFIEIALSP